MDKDQWKRLLTPFVSKSQLPFFTFDNNNESAERFPVRIKSIKGAVSQPVDKGGKIFQDVLGDGFMVKFRIPLLEADAQFQLPIKQKLPKITIDPAGFVTVTLGSPMAEDFFKDKTNWKNKELKDYGAYMKDYEKKGVFKNYASQYAAALDYYSENKLTFMAESKLSFGWFVLASGRWLIDNQIEDVTHTTVSIRGAVGVTLKYAFSMTIKFAVGPARSTPASPWPSRWASRWAARRPSPSSTAASRTGGCGLRTWSSMSASP